MTTLSEVLKKKERCYFVTNSILLTLRKLFLSLSDKLFRNIVVATDDETGETVKFDVLGFVSYEGRDYVIEILCDHENAMVDVARLTYHYEGEAERENNCNEGFPEETRDVILQNFKRKHPFRWAMLPQNRKSRI